MAEPLTCDHFKQKLSASIRAGGDLVAQPFDYKPDANDDTRQNFQGIVGLYGSVTCMSGNFFAFGATADLKAPADESGNRNVRVVALAAASICAVEAVTPRACMAMASGMNARAIKELAASRRRGDPSAAGVGQHDLTRSGADAQFDADDNGTVTFSLNVSPKQSVEDLSVRPR